MADNLFDLTGKTALITGGSRGLGLQMAEAIGDAGARLVISSRKADALEKATAHLRARGITADYIVADNVQEADVLRLADEALATLGRVDILVNNAGTGWNQPAEDHTLEAWDNVMNLNIRSLFILAQQIAKRSMIPNRYGRILNISSVSGYRGSPGIVSYNASKGAVINFTRGLAADWGPHGITVNCLAPGMFPSDLTKGLFEKFGHEHFSSVAPLRRVGDDQDLKGATLLFVSDAGKHITGQTLTIDGGVSAVV